MKQTVGKIASDLMLKTPYSNDPIEIQRATEREYLENLEWCVKHALKQVDCSSIAGHDECKNRAALEGDFYVAALLKKEKLLQNVLRNYFVATKSCPTPTFDQTIYKYNSKKEAIEFLWVVPDQETALTLKENKQIVVAEERGLLQFVLDYYDGNLHRICKKLNGETMDAGSMLIGV
jgi:hypothetical protein